jgi:ABC-type enterobactin transport system permease subunit
MTVIEYVSIGIAVAGTVARIALFFPQVNRSLGNESA